MEEEGRQRLSNFERAVVRRNPFVKVSGQRKRVHKFSENVQKNESQLLKRLDDQWQPKHDATKNHQIVLK